MKYLLLILMIMCCSIFYIANAELQTNPYASLPHYTNNYYDKLDTFIDTNFHYWKHGTRLSSIKAAYNIVNKIKYTSEAEGVDYPQYPKETIWLKTGDCEDKSFLLASLLKYYGEDVWLVVEQTHVLVAIKVDTELPFKGDNICFLESTTPYYGCGPEPDKKYTLTHI